MSLREAPSGRVIVGTATGQVLTWNQTDQEWNADEPAVRSGAVGNDTGLPGPTLDNVFEYLYPPAAELIDVLVSGPLVLELRPAGHAPGLYTLALAVVVRTAGPGSLVRSYQFSAPSGPLAIGGFGPFSLTIPGAPTAGITSVSCASSGVSPITVTLTPSAPSTARIDVFATAHPLARL